MVVDGAAAVGGVVVGEAPAVDGRVYPPVASGQVPEILARSAHVPVGPTPPDNCFFARPRTTQRSLAVVLASHIVSHSLLPVLSLR
eukprot:COSAG05_NODE_723_length_7727_cov_19.327871_4_plen_86_part_00